MSTKIKIVAVLGALAVAIGAFGAHGLKPHLTELQLETFKTGSLYHFIHLMPLLLFSLLADNSRVVQLSFYMFCIGILLFSGSLYILSTKHLYGGDMWNFVGPITPIGGLFFIVGWLNLIRYKSK